MNAQLTARQFSTFYICGQLFGIDVMDVQEIAKPLPLTPIHRAPDHIKGLINLRGQISTAISLREILRMEAEENVGKMTVVCRNEEGLLISILVDQIGDVMELEDTAYEKSPITLSSEQRQFISGVYKTSGNILTIIDVKRLFQDLEIKENV